jgi:hypothetical protein
VTAIHASYLRGLGVVSWPTDQLICFSDYIQSLQTNVQMKEEYDLLGYNVVKFGRSPPMFQRKRIASTFRFEE